VRNRINVIDQVTQWEIIASTPQISELWLLPVLEDMLGQFPFVIRGFHSDNGSEFINYAVARLLDKLLIEQTKSPGCGPKRGRIIAATTAWWRPRTEPSSASISASATSTPNTPRRWIDFIGTI
jgi:hypothetical protein